MATLIPFILLSIFFLGTAHAFLPIWLSAFTYPRCPPKLPTPECSCKIGPLERGTVIQCTPSETIDYDYIIEVIAKHGGLIDDLVIRNCPSNLGKLQPLPRLKVYHLAITNCGITEVDKRAFVESAFWLDHLDLSNNHISSVNFGISQLYHLLKLNLEHNQLRAIPKDTFIYNKELRELLLHGNVIEEFSKEAFDKSTSKLAALGLSSNRLKTLTNGLFAQQNVEDESFKSLQWINVRDNRIHHIGQYAFGKHPKLYGIDLSSNQISTVSSPIFGHMPELQWLNVNYNNLTSVDVLSLPNLPALQELHLSKNKITRISDQTFKWNPNLWKLDLSKNQLMHIPEKAFDSHFMFDLNVDDNPLSALEKLKWSSDKNALKTKLDLERQKCLSNKQASERLFGTYDPTLLRECNGSKFLKFATAIGM